MQKTSNLPPKKVVKHIFLLLCTDTRAHTHIERNEHRGRMKTQVKEREGGFFFLKKKKKRFQFAGFKCGEVAETAELGCAWADVSQAQ